MLKHGINASRDFCRFKQDEMNQEQMNQEQIEEMKISCASIFGFGNNPLYHFYIQYNNFEKI